MLNEFQSQLIEVIGLNVSHRGFMLIKPLGLEELPIVHTSHLTRTDISYQDQAREEPERLWLIGALSLALLDPDLIVAPLCVSLVIALVNLLTSPVAQCQIPLRRLAERERLPSYI